MYPGADDRVETSRYETMVTGEKLSKTEGLKSLGSGKTDYVFVGADKRLLERFPNPMVATVKDYYAKFAQTQIEIVAPEFTSLCPLTKQPDYATIVVKYTPRDWCVESKSWKMYLNTFRNFGEFHESCVTRMFNDLWELLYPKSLYVQGQFTPRGGISFWPVMAREAPDGL